MEKRGGKKIERGVRRGVRPKMKRKETALGGSAEECDVPRRRIGEVRPTKRSNAELGCLEGIQVVVVVPGA